MTQPVQITTFYRFLPLSLDAVERSKTELESLARSEDLRGLILLGKEGINATVSGSGQALVSLKKTVRERLGENEIVFKDSAGPKHPFEFFKVKIKNEIVSLGRPDLAPQTAVNNHLSPAAWREALKDPEVLLLDTRNDYEIEIGKFKGAKDFALKEFNEFPKRLRASNLPKEQKVLMYCTGGIRCEKAILEMRDQGFQNVYQLDGGILNYLKEYPEADFEGECFVFDYRVAVDQRLKPTQKYSLCPHCGQPAEKKISCVQCGREEVICTNCIQNNVKTCSKNCAHHFAIGSGSRKSHIGELRKRKKL